MMGEAFKSPLNHKEVTAEDYEEALSPKGLAYEQELNPPQESQVDRVADQVANQPTEFVPDIDPEARRRFEQFVAYREAMKEQPGFVLDAAPKGVRGVVTRLTKWWRARQDRVAVPSYTKVAPWDHLGVVATAGGVIDNNPNSTLY